MFLCHAIAEAAGCHILTRRPHVHSQGNLCGIYSDKVALMQIVLQHLSFPIAISINA
jgi:hypothetical protein